jgi:hypothetical protein
LLLVKEAVMSKDTIDIHNEPDELVSAFRNAHPNLAECVRMMAEHTLGQPLGDGDWVAIVYRITEDYEPEQLQRLDAEAVTILPHLPHALPEDADHIGKPEWMSDEFDQFGFFVANEL